MTRILHELERSEARVLGALRMVDAATGADIDSGLRVRALDGSASFVRSRSGLQVIAHWAPLAAHAAAFESPPAQPAVASRQLRVAIEDASGRYLPRTVALALPRDPDPAHALQDGSLFRPIVVPMYLASAAATGPNWSVLRVTLTEEGSGDALGGALLRVRRNGDVLAHGMTDWRGEALVPVVGVPVMTFGEDENAVVVDAINVALEAVFDPAVGSRLPAQTVRVGRAPAWPAVDPADLEARIDDLPNTTRSLAIAARRSQSVAMTLELP